MTDKCCNLCKVTKPKSEFYPHSRPGEYQVTCKLCHKDKIRLNYHRKRKLADPSYEPKSVWNKTIETSLIDPTKWDEIE